MTETRLYDITVEAGQELETAQCMVLHHTGDVEPAEPASPINAGNAGVVYRGQTDQGMDVAIKLLSPRTKEGTELDPEKFLTTFTREIGILSRVTHTRVAKILRSGTVELHGNHVPFYVMEYISGNRFCSFLESESVSGVQFIQLFDEVLDGVEHLHRQRIMHADLKDENILLRSQFDQLDAKIVDLGVAKVLGGVGSNGGGEETSSDDDEAETYFYSSPKITRPEWKPRLGSRIPRAELEAMFPSHDLFALGVLIDESLQVADLKTNLLRELGPEGLDALCQVRDRLTCKAGDEYYADVSELRADWQKLHPGYLAPLAIPELAPAARAATSIATPTGRVSLTDRALRVVNHRLMQRLRRIPQLELIQLVYPGATHTRLLHSISTFDTARRFASHLLRDPTFRLLADPPEVEALLLSGLCHDVGHYPLSHMFEDWSYEETLAGGERTIPTDDDLFWVFVDPERAQGLDFGGYVETVAERLEGDPTLHDSIFGEGGFDDTVREALWDMRSLEKPSHKLLRGVLNSPIDADKIAYLTDDSTMTGVRYGLGLDLDALFGSLRTPRLEDIPSESVPVVAIGDKGLPAVEQLMLARYWMLRRVYWHHTSRAIMAMIKFAIAALREAGALDMRDYFRHTLFAGPHEALDFLSRSLREQSDAGKLGPVAPVDPLRGLQDGRRDLYKRVLTLARGDAGVYGEAYEILSQRRGPALMTATDAIREGLGHLLESELRPGEVIVDVPLRERGRFTTPVLVYLQKREGDPSLIQDASPVIDELVKEFDSHVHKARVFVAPEVRESLSALTPAHVRQRTVEAIRQL